MRKILLNRYQYDDLLIRSSDPYANTKYEIILDWLQRKKIKNVLNAGCGSGDFSFLLSQNNYLVDSFDIDTDYIDLAKKKAKKLGLHKRCSFLVSDIKSFSKRKKYDMVVANDVLEHIDNDKDAINDLGDLVKCGGILAVTVPAGQYLFGYHDINLGHFRRYSKNNLKKIVPNDFEIKKLNYFGFFLIPVCFLYSKILKKSYPVAKMGEEKNFNIVSKFLNILLKVEKKVSLGIGTSLILIARKI